MVLSQSEYRTEVANGSMAPVQPGHNTLEPNMLARTFRKQLAAYGRWVAHNNLHVLSSADDIRRYILEGNERGRKQPIEGAALDYVVATVQREHKQHRRLMRSVGL